MTTNDPTGTMLDQYYAMLEEMEQWEDELCNQVEPPNPDEYEDLGCPDCGGEGADVTTLGKLITGLQIIAKYTPTTGHCVDVNHGVAPQTGLGPTPRSVQGLFERR